MILEIFIPNIILILEKPIFSRSVADGKTKIKFLNRSILSKGHFRKEVDINNNSRYYELGPKLEKAQTQKANLFGVYLKLLHIFYRNLYIVNNSLFI